MESEMYKEPETGKIVPDYAVSEELFSCLEREKKLNPWESATTFELEKTKDTLRILVKNRVLDVAHSKQLGLKYEKENLEMKTLAEAWEIVAEELRKREEK